MNTTKADSINNCGSYQQTELELLRGLPPSQLEQLLGLLKRKRFPAGTTLMTHEQSGEAVYFIRGGTVKVHVEQANGGDVIIAILGPGDVVGEMSALDSTARSATAVTLEDSSLLWLDRESFRRCLLTMPALSFNLNCLLSSRLRQANEQIQVLATLEAEQRIARQLLYFAEKYGRTQPNGRVLIPIRLTQSDVAALVGVSREYANKILVSYKERNYLSVDPTHHITIHDMQAIVRRR